MSDPSDPTTRSLPADPAARPHDPDATRTAEPASAVPPPDLPPNYALLGELGRGAMGVVYRARQVMLHREVALKLILAGRHASSSQLARFLAEVQAAAAVDHPNVVRVHDSGEHAGTPYLAMELVGGGSLSEKLAGGPLPPREAAELVAKVADGVQAAHAAGIVHRDLKPGNILLTADGTPKVADFGLAKQVDGSDLTHTGAILGTPGYMAPEQARGGTKAVGPPADVYALGAVLFHCLAGRPPFVGDDPLQVVFQVAHDDPPSLTQFNRTVPRDMATVCHKCLRKEPAERYPTAGDLAADLRRFVAGEPVAARRVGWARRVVRTVWRNRLVALTACGIAVVICVPLGLYALVAVGLIPLPRQHGKPPSVRSSESSSPPTTAVKRPTVSPLLYAQLFLSASEGDPTSQTARKYTTPDFKHVYTSPPLNGRTDRPYFQFTDAKIDRTAPPLPDGDAVWFLGTAQVLSRQIQQGGGLASLPSGGKANFQLTLRPSPDNSSWQVSEFEFYDRGCRAGPAALPELYHRQVIRDTLNYPPEAFKKDDLAALEKKLGLQSWVFYYTGGPIAVWLEIEEQHSDPIGRVNPLAPKDHPIVLESYEGRFCLQVGRILDRDTLEPMKYIRLRLDRRHTDLPDSHLWYGWKGATIDTELEPFDSQLTFDKETTLMSVLATETEPEKGKEARKVELHLKAKRVGKK